MLSIPNYLPSRQGKSLELLHPFSTVSTKNGNLPCPQSLSSIPIGLLIAGFAPDEIPLSFIGMNKEKAM
jgi:hypothetical protein